MSPETPSPEPAVRDQPFVTSTLDRKHLTDHHKMSSLAEASPRQRKVYPDQQLYVPRPRRQCNGEGTAMNTEMKSGDDPKQEHPAEESSDKPSKRSSRRRKPVAGDSASPNVHTQLATEENGNQTSDRHLPSWKRKRVEERTRMVKEAQKGEGSTPMPLSVSEKRHTSPAEDHQHAHINTCSGYPSKGYTHAQVDKSDDSSMLEDSYGYGHEGRQAPLSHPTSKRMEYQSTSKSRPQVSQFLRENQAAAKKIMQAPCDPGQGLQHKANGSPSGARSSQLPHIRSNKAKTLPAAQAVILEPPKAIGNWNTADAWAGKTKIKTPVPDSFYDMDFSSRPPNDIVIKIAHTVIDKSGKQVVQKPVNPRNRTEFPSLPEIVQLPQQNEDIPPHKRIPTKNDRSRTPSPHEPTSLPRFECDLVDLKQTPEGAATPRPTGILRYFRPVASIQVHQPDASSPELKPAGGKLLTDGSAFLTRALSALAKNKTSYRAEASSLPLKTTSANTQSSPVMDQVIANINAKTTAFPEPDNPNSSNESVCGRADAKLSRISASLNFEDTFKGRNPSVKSEKSAVLYRSRQPKDSYAPADQANVSYLPKDYEPGQLKGWDGKWAPAPVEWDLRDMYNCQKPQHRDRIKNFVVDRYQAFKSGLCPALNVEGSETFTSGASLAVGFSHFGKPIDPNDHHHHRATDPFTLNKLHQTAASSTVNFVRNHRRLFGKEKKPRAKKLTKEEEDKMREEYEAMLCDTPLNPFKPVANIYIRPARLKDLPQIRAIHNHYTRISPVTQERIELGDRDMRARFDDCKMEQYPFIVAISRHGRTAEKDEMVVGFAYAEDYGGEQTMWRHTCEVQFYVDARYLRKGIGKNLLDTLFRGITPYYHYHNGVPFEYTDEEFPRHDGGGARMVRKVLIPFPYFAEEEDKHKWMGPWLEREFEFEYQGTLKGIGHAGVGDKPVNYAHFMHSTGAH